MPAIINSAPDCIVHKEGYDGDDVADFIVNNNYADCAGFMTFGPGSTYGEEGVGAAGAYMALTWIGIVVVVLVFAGWIIYEKRRLEAFAATGLVPAGPTDEPPPQPGQT
jgi:TM2 domain-containing membrane protein YozV